MLNLWKDVIVMADTKARSYVRPSSLGSYFGVGFNDPDRQIELDMGNIEESFDDASIARMDLGKFLEDATLNYFEKALGITITERNDDLWELYDGKILGKVDGVTTLNGIKTVVECKISNAASYKFTDNAGYLFQVQAYMIDNDFEQALLCGLYQGKPIYRIIKRDDEIIEDIKAMVDFVVDVMYGMADFENEFPYQLLTKYSSTKMLKTVESVDEHLREYWLKLGELNKQAKEIEDKIKALKKEYATVLDDFEDISDIKFEDDFIKVSVVNKTRRGSISIDALSIDYPDIDFEKYRDEPTSYTQTTIKLK